MLRTDIDSFLDTLPQNIILIAATKYVDCDEIRIMYNHHIYNFGENRVDTFLKKYYSLKDLDDIKWHFIGHLQRNKALDVINKIDCLHSLDSLELAKIINMHRKKPLDVFVEVSINMEENKNGVLPKDLQSFIEKLIMFKNINLIGFMMMAVKNSNEESLKIQFSKLSKLRDEISGKLNLKIPYLSMGMSDDYKVAIKCGATHIRLGRILYKM